jgi:hypothetical protein
MVCLRNISVDTLRKEIPRMMMMMTIIIIIILIIIICCFGGGGGGSVRISLTAELDAVVVKGKPTSLMENAVHSFGPMPVIIHTAVSTHTG